jgi:hypothetical protein
VLVSNISILYMINRSPRIAVVSTDEQCFPEQSGRVNRPTRPSAQHNPFKTDPQYPCELRVVGLGAVGNQLSHFLGSLHEELRLETHSYPAVLTKSCVQKRTKVPRYWRTKVHWYEHKGPLERKKEIPTHPLAPVRSTGDTRPNPATCATDSHDALTSVTTR